MSYYFVKKYFPNFHIKTSKSTLMKKLTTITQGTKYTLNQKSNYTPAIAYFINNLAYL